MENLIIAICSIGSIAIITPYIWKAYKSNIDSYRQDIITDISESRKILSDAEKALQNQSKIIESAKMKARSIIAEAKKTTISMMNNVDNEISTMKIKELQKEHYKISKIRKDTLLKFYNKAIEASIYLSIKHVIPDSSTYDENSNLDKIDKALRH